MLRFIITLISILSGSLSLAAEVPIVIELKPTRDSAARELISIEAFKLIYGAPKADPVVEFASGSVLDSAVRDRLEALQKEALGQLAAGKDLRPKGPLTLTQVLKAYGQGAPFTMEQKEELLTTLRLQDLGAKLAGTPSEKVKAILLSELKAWVLDGKTPVELPASLKAALAKRLRDEAGRQSPPKKLTAAELEAALKDPATVLALTSALSPDAFGLIEWMRIAGNLRISGRTDRPDTSTADLREELGKRLADIGVQNQIGRGVQVPRVAFQAPRPSFQPNQTPCPAPKHSGQGFAAPPDFRGQGSAPGRSGVVHLDRPLPGAVDIDQDSRRRLEAERDMGHLSLPFITHYAKSPSSACQITLVKPQEGGLEEVGEGKCSYNAITARHCVEDDGGARFTDAEIPPFASISVTRLDADHTGGDLAMMSFTAECRNDVPMAPLALQAPHEQEGILVYAAVPLIGEASANGANSTRLMMNVRDSSNGGIGIEHGNSGGAVVNELGQIVGVISTKLESADGQGIGFFATRDALNFANEFVNPNFVAILNYKRSMDRSTASLDAPGH